MFYSVFFGQLFFYSYSTVIDDATSWNVETGGDTFTAFKSVSTLQELDASSGSHLPTRIKWIQNKI